MESEHTYNYLTTNTDYENVDNRPFILSRSTFAGSGRFAAHWLGDNNRTWESMAYSISGIMNFQMFGIPMTGADIGGFFGYEKVLDQDIVSRWIQLATFYPFARIHYCNDSNPSEPYRLKDDYLKIATESMFDRYQYLRLLYTCLFESSIFGTTCFDPVFYHYPQDDTAHDNDTSSFIFANAIKVSPIIKPDVATGKTFESYFPKGKWVSLVSPKTVIDGA
jgi:alpha-glucosidase (family GH31 glycosyl hydrolase)